MEDLIKNTEYICVALVCIFTITSIGLCIIIGHLKVIIGYLKIILENNDNILKAIEDNTNESLQIKGHSGSIMTAIDELNDKL